MLYKEFQDLTGVSVTPEQFKEIHEEYMNSSLDKQDFCKGWKRENLSGATSYMAYEIIKLRQKLEACENMRARERESMQDKINKLWATINRLEEKLKNIKQIICSIR